MFTRFVLLVWVDVGALGVNVITVLTPMPGAVSSPVIEIRHIKAIESRWPANFFVDFRSNGSITCYY